MSAGQSNAGPVREFCDRRARRDARGSAAASPTMDDFEYEVETAACHARPVHSPLTRRLLDGKWKDGRASGLDVGTIDVISVAENTEGVSRVWEGQVGPVPVRAAMSESE